MTSEIIGVIGVGGGVLLTLIITTIYRAISGYFKNRVYFRSPERRAVDKLIPAVNMMLPIVGSLLQANKVLLESQLGDSNASKKDTQEALKSIELVEKEYTAYMLEKARVCQ